VKREEEENSRERKNSSPVYCALWECVAKPTGDFLLIETLACSPVLPPFSAGGIIAGSDYYSIGLLTP